MVHREPLRRRRQGEGYLERQVRLWHRQGVRHPRLRRRQGPAGFKNEKYTGTRLFSLFFRSTP